MEDEPAKSAGPRIWYLIAGRNAPARMKGITKSRDEVAEPVITGQPVGLDYPLLAGVLLEAAQKAESCLSKQCLRAMKCSTEHPCPRTMQGHSQHRVSPIAEAVVSIAHDHHVADQKIRGRPIRIG